MERNGEILCKRCGACCLTDFLAYVTDKDLERWKAHDRQDIIDAVEGSMAMWAGDRMVDKCSGTALGQCTFLEGHAGEKACRIYTERPQVCRNFKPASSPLCPQWHHPHSS